MSKYRKIFHHVSSKDVRKKHQDGITQLRIKEEKKIKLLDYTSSAMEVVKYDWRSDGDLSAELREAMTTANVYQKLGDTSEDGELEDHVIDTTIEASFEDGPVNGLDNMMLKQTMVSDGGSGVGANGGFDIGKHLKFGGTTSSDGSNYVSTESRHALLKPIDARNIDTITVTAIRGNDSNGGELPDYQWEDLTLMWFNADPNGYGGVGSWGGIDFDRDGNHHWQTNKIIIPVVSGDSGGYDGSFPALRDWTIEIPEWCKNKNQRFGLYQQKHSGYGYDHYGITQIKYRARTPMNAFVALDKPEASSFVRFGTNEGDPKKRKKKLEDQLKASKEYTDTVLGTDFPGGSATLSEPTPSPIGYDNLSKTHIQAGTLSQQLKKALASDKDPDAPKDSKALSAIKAAAADKVATGEFKGDIDAPGEKGKYGEQEYIKTKDEYDTATTEVDKKLDDLKDVRGLSDAKYKDIRYSRDLPTNTIINSVAEVLRKVTGGFSLPVDLTLKYALGDMTPVTKSPGAAYDKATLEVLRVAHQRSGLGDVDAKRGDYSGTGNYDQTNLLTFQTASVQGAKNNFSYQVSSDGIRILDTFNFTDPKKAESTTIGAFKSIWGAQFLATKLVEIGDWKARYTGNDPRDESYGVPIDYTIPLSALSQSDKDIFYGKPGSAQRKWVDSYNNIANNMNKSLIPFHNRMNEIVKEQGALVGQKTWEYRNLQTKSNEVNKFVTEYGRLANRKDYDGINSLLTNENIPSYIKSELGGQVPRFDDNGEVTYEPLKNEYGVEYNPDYEISEETLERFRKYRIYTSSESREKAIAQAPYAYNLGGNSITGVAGEGGKVFKIWGRDTNLYEAQAYSYWDGIGWTPSHVGSNHWQGHAPDGYFSKAMKYMYDPELKADPERRERFLKSMEGILRGRSVGAQMAYYRNFGKTSWKFAKEEPDGRGGKRRVPGYYHPGETYYQSQLAYWKNKIEESGGTFVDFFDTDEWKGTDTGIDDTGIDDTGTDTDDTEEIPSKPENEIDPDEKVNDDDSEKVTSEDEKWLDTKQTLVNLTKVLTHIGLPNDFGQWSINYAKGDMTPITQFSPGMRREVESMVLKKFKENPGSNTVDIEYSDYGWRFKNMSTRLGLGRFTATRLPNGKVRINDTFNVDQTFKTVGSFDIIPTLQDTANRIVDIAHKRRSGTGDIKHGTYDEGGIPVEVTLDMKSKLNRLDLSVDDPVVRDPTVPAASKKKRKKSDYTNIQVVESKKENSFDKIRRVSRDYDYDKIKVVEEPIVIKPKVKVVQEIKKRSDWRTELKESDWTPVSSGRPTMSTSQTFQHASGATATFNALSGPDAHSNTVNITAFGETFPVDAPPIKAIALQGHASPIDPWKMARKKNAKSAKQINAQLRAAKDATQRASGASEFMKGRVEGLDDKLKEFLHKEETIAKKNDKIREANRAKVDAYVSSKGFSFEKLEKDGALVDDKGYGIVITNWNHFGGKIMRGKIEIGYGRPYTRKDTTQDGEFLGRKNEKGEWYYPDIPEMEARDGQLFKGMPVGKPKVFDLEKGTQELPVMSEEVSLYYNKVMEIKSQLADYGLLKIYDKYLKFEDYISKIMGVKGAKAIFDYYMQLSGSNFDKDHNLTGLLSDRAQNVLRDFFKNNPQIVKNYWGEYNAGRGVDFGEMIDSDGDLSNVIGNLDQKAGDYIQDKGSYIEIRKAYDFDNLADLMGGEAGGVGAFAYALRKNLLLRHMITFNKFGIPVIKKSPTMKIIIRIDKKTGKIISKGQDTRKALSLDEPIVIDKKKKKKVQINKK